MTIPIGGMILVAPLNMTVSSNSSLFFIGLLVGVLVALGGGAVEYVLHLRRNRPPFSGMPSCLLFTIGGLILAGGGAILTSLIVTGGVWPALVMGLGVMAGFYGAFMLLVGLWLLLESRGATSDSPLPTETGPQ
jgi:hypothetical protein